MPRVLIVSEEPGFIGTSILVNALRNLGITSDLAYGTSPTGMLQTGAGAFSGASPDLRHYFRQFDAVFVVERRTWDSSNGVGIAAHWLRWNANDDTPILYFGWNLSSVATQINGLLPADFPLIRPNPTSETTLRYTVAIADNGARLWETHRQRFGTAIYLLREHKTLYIPTACCRGNDNRIAYWRLDPARHATLGASGEILAIPAIQPDESYAQDVIAAYRYKNHYFMPIVCRSTSLYAHHVDHNIFLDVFWLIYGLKLVGVLPCWQLPLHFETDHPIQLWGANQLTDVAKLSIIRDTFAWWRDFCRQTSLVVCNGVRVGGRDRFSTTMHWNLLHHSNPDIRSVAQQIHAILVNEHTKSLPCGVHDHTLAGGNGYWGAVVHRGFRRHSDSGYRYAAPNSVPFRHGKISCARHVLPEGGLTGSLLEDEIGGIRFVEQMDIADYTGSAVQFDLPMGNVHAARMILEGEIAEMRAMGFPDGHCGEHRYTNTARNFSGGEAYWQAALEMGFRALRSDYRCNATAVGQLKCLPPNRIWKGLHLLPHGSLDVSRSGSGGCWGLYDPTPGLSFTGHAVGNWELDYEGDITGDYPNTVWRAYRRAMCVLTSLWLSLSVGNLGAPYIHPVASWFGASPQQPVARFAGTDILNAAGFPHWNPTVELMEIMRDIVVVLSDYLKFGSVSDLLTLREKLL
jgi:hypothetical protein